MVIGRKWSTGHGRELEILSNALNAADHNRIWRCRDELKGGRRILDALDAVLQGRDLGRRNAAGVKLPDWDPRVTQYRWYDPTARFWIRYAPDTNGELSTPYQIDLIMRKALVKCCDIRLGEDVDSRTIALYGVCEKNQFRVRYVEPDPNQHGVPVTFWIEVPDHWGSGDFTGRDGDGRYARDFVEVAGDEVGGDVRPVMSEEAVPIVGNPFDQASAQMAMFTVLQWADGPNILDPRPDRQLEADEVPPSEQRRLALIERVVGAQGMRRLQRPLQARPAAAGQGVPAAQGAPPPRSALHGSPPIPAGDNLPSIDSRDGLYGRLFPAARPLDGLRFHAVAEEIEAIADRMLDDVAGPDEPVGPPTDADNPYIDAIYTYFGQFIDHDLTFDPSSSLQRIVDPTYTVDFRTPRFDLDAIYGGGPRDRPYLYDADGRFRLGRPIDSSAGNNQLDIPRDAGGSALIVDPRNNQHLIISQLTALFLRFHNTLMDERGADGNPRTFLEVQQLVRWHYQWLVLYHFLPTVIGDEKASSYLWSAGSTAPTGPDLVQSLTEQLRLNILGERWGPFMPVEFSAAAFRFGHSMVRPSYVINAEARRGRPIPTIAEDGRSLVSLTAEGKPPKDHGVNWSFFVRDLDDPAIPNLPQPSRRIDTHLFTGFANLQPPGLIPAPDPGDPVSLPGRTMRRGLLLRLPSGQQVAGELRSLGYRDVDKLEPADLGLPTGTYTAQDTPLWYYILKEAEVTRNGYRLGPVGGTILAEVVLGLLVHDRQSFLHYGWVPDDGDFTLADLVRRGQSWTG